MNEIIKNIEAAQLKASVPEFHVGDTVKVFYTSNSAKGWIGERCGEPRYDGGYSLEPITSITINSNIDYSVHTNAGIERYVGIFEGE